MVQPFDARGNRGDVLRIGAGYRSSEAAAVDNFLVPARYLDLAGDVALRGVLDRLTIVVQAASRRIQAAFGRDIVDHPGFRDALLAAATVINAGAGRIAAHPWSDRPRRKFLDPRNLETLPISRLDLA